MSIQTILASGFLLLGGIFLPYWAAAPGWLQLLHPFAQPDFCPAGGDSAAALPVA